MASLYNTHSKVVEQGRNFYAGFLNVVQNNVQDSEKEELFQTVRELLENTIKNECMVKNAKQSIESFQDQINNNEDTKIPIEDIKKEYENGLSSSCNERTFRNLCNEDSDLNKIKEVLHEIQGPKGENEDDSNEDVKDNEEITATQEDLNLIDPISKKMMENPVRHIPCGHVYDRDSTLAMIKQRKRKGFRCPYMGCEYRRPIVVADLEVALDYKRELERRKSSTKYGNSSV